MIYEDKLYTTINGEKVISPKVWFLQYAQNISLVRSALDSFQWELSNISTHRNTSDDLLYYARVDSAVLKLENWLAGRDLTLHYALSISELDDLREATGFLAAMCTRTPPGWLETSFYAVLARVREEAEGTNQAALTQNFEKLSKHAQTLRVRSEDASQLVYLLIKEEDKLH